MPKDSFQESRQKEGILKCPFQGEEIPMLLRHADVRAAAKDWQTFSSDAPFRVPIPSEEEMRTMRQLPIETNPPEHTEYRKIVEPFFKRSRTPEVVKKVQDLVNGLLEITLTRDNPVEVVHQFALPIQSRALTYLLNVPESEAKTYIGWGIHVFHDENGSGSQLEDYLAFALERSAKNPGEDLFSALNQATFQNRALTHEEKMGFANLTFAGGRDTIIHSISSIIAHFGEHPEDLKSLRNNPKGLVIAGEEFFRVFMPLTHIGRVCPVETIVGGNKIPPGGRVSLGWAAANFDPEVFDQPGEVILDRKPNPHVSFGFGTHLCLGAPHARLIIRSLLEALVSKVAKIEVVEAAPHLEKNPAYSRKNGFDKLEVRMLAC
ncbi:cytochrome P450 [bacterium]|jgi:cytochrome P450|nr:cytochrome P450 [bacterium]